jgi:hypothetical protein
LKKVFFRGISFFRWKNESTKTGDWCNRTPAGVVARDDVIARER